MPVYIKTRNITFYIISLLLKVNTYLSLSLYILLVLLYVWFAFHKTHALAYMTFFKYLISIHIFMCAYFKHNAYAFFYKNNLKKKKHVYIMHRSALYAVIPTQPPVLVSTANLQHYRTNCSRNFLNFYIHFLSFLNPGPCYFLPEDKD